MNKEALLNIINTSIDAYTSGIAVNEDSSKIAELRKELKHKEHRMSYAEAEMDIRAEKIKNLQFALETVASSIKSAYWCKYIIEKDGKEEDGWVCNKAKNIYAIIKNVLPTE